MVSFTITRCDVGWLFGIKGWICVFERAGLYESVLCHIELKDKIGGSFGSYEHNNGVKEVKLPRIGTW